MMAMALHANIYLYMKKDILILFSLCPYSPCMYIPIRANTNFVIFPQYWALCLLPNPVPFMPREC